MYELQNTLNTGAEVVINKILLQTRGYYYIQATRSSLLHSICSIEPAKDELLPQHWFKALLVCIITLCS